MADPTVLTWSGPYAELKRTPLAGQRPVAAVQIMRLSCVKPARKTIDGSVEQGDSEDQLDAEGDLRELHLLAVDHGADEAEGDEDEPCGEYEGREPRRVDLRKAIA